MRSGGHGMCIQHYKRSLLNRPDWVSGWVPAAEAQRHIELLHSQGMTYVQIARVAGLGDESMRMVRKRKRILAMTARAILSVSPTVVIHSGIIDNRTRIPAVGTARRIQAMVAMGYGMADLGAQVDLSRAAISKIAHGHQRLVQVDTARKIDKLFRHLALTPAPNGSSKLRALDIARKFGWVALPLDWDEDMIDDPEAQPCVTSVNKDAWHEDYLELKELGKSDEHIAERLGITYEALRVRLRRHNATASSDQEHQQVRESDEQMVRPHRQGMEAF